MAENTLTDLIPDLMIAADTVSQELVGLIPAVSRDSTAERAGQGDTVRSFITPSATAYDLEASITNPDNGEQTIGNETMTISKVRYCPVRWNGEQQRSINNGIGYNRILQDQFAQAMRTLVNEIEADLASTYVSAARAVAPSGTTLFDSAATVGRDVANCRKVLADLGAPLSDMQLVLNTTAGAALRGQPQYSGANTAGQTDILRQGILADLSGFKIRESAAIATHTNGDYDSLALTDAIEPVGETSISVNTDGSGGVLPGDVIEINSNGELLVVSTANADTDSGNIDINHGLTTATASGQAVALNASLQRNMFFDRNAIALATRAPALPSEGDSAVDRVLVTDPRSGLTFEISKYLERRRVRYEVAIAYGFKVFNAKHLGLLID